MSNQMPETLWQAQGILMGRHGSTAERAMERLAEAAKQNGRSVTDEARALVSSVGGYAPDEVGNPADLSPPRPAQSQ